MTHIAAQMTRLSVLRGVPEGIDVYAEALGDIPADVFEAAVGHALKTRAWFPTPAELRLDADVVARQVRPVEPAEDRSTPLAAPFTITVPEVGTVVSITREWKYYCETCADSGWASRWCGDAHHRATAWQQQLHCGRSEGHLPHEWIERCPCYQTNPALVRRREAQRQYAAKPGKVE